MGTINDILKELNVIYKDRILGSHAVYLQSQPLKRRERESRLLSLIAATESFGGQLDYQNEQYVMVVSDPKNLPETHIDLSIVHLGIMLQNHLRNADPIGIGMDTREKLFAIEDFDAPRDHPYFVPMYETLEKFGYEKYEE